MFPETPGTEAVAFAIGERGYLGLGQDSTTSPYNDDWWEYNPLTDNWTRKADFGGGGRVAASSFDLNGKGYVGSGFAATSVSGDLWQYTPASQDTTPPACPPGKQVAVKIPDVYPLLFWGPANTLYEGFGPPCATLRAFASGGTTLQDGGYQFTWSNGSTGSFTRVCAEKAGVFTDTVTVTDALGCTTTATKTITVLDVRCGHDGRKVQVCVRERRGTKSLCLSPQEAAIAVLFGARPGTCPMTANAGDAEVDALAKGWDTGTASGDTSMMVFPNPNNGMFTLRLSNIQPSELRIFDQGGTMVAKRIVSVYGKSSTVTVDDVNLPGGIYIVQAIGKDGVYTSKVVVQR